ncbi:MAG: hypothetical protein AB8B88_02260 [Devosiaceae bacterium]
MERGKASKIKPSHVEKVLIKLKKKSKDLESDIASAHSADKKARLKKKLGVAGAQIERAEWLLKKIT